MRYYSPSLLNGNCLLQSRISLALHTRTVCPEKFLTQKKVFEQKQKLLNEIDATIIFGERNRRWNFEQINPFSSITSVTTLLCHRNLSLHKLGYLNEHSFPPIGERRAAEVFLHYIRFLTHDQTAMHVLGEDGDDTELVLCIVGV